MKKWIIISAIGYAFVLAACHKAKNCPGSTDKNFFATGFSRLNAGGDFNLTVNRASNFSVYAEGCASDLADLDLSPSAGETLNIGYKNFKCNRNKVNLTITLPKLNSINLSGDAKGSINGFKDQASVIRSVLSGNATCILIDAVDATQFELSGNADPTVRGSTENLYGNLSGNCVLNAYDLTATDADINASGNSKDYVVVLRNFYADASGNGHICYKGNPMQTPFEASGNGKITNE